MFVATEFEGCRDQSRFHPEELVAPEALNRVTGGFRCTWEQKCRFVDSGGGDSLRGAGIRHSQAEFKGAKHEGRFTKFAGRKRKLRALRFRALEFRSEKNGYHRCSGRHDLPVEKRSQRWVLEFLGQLVGTGFASPRLRLGRV